MAERFDALWRAAPRTIMIIGDHERHGDPSGAGSDDASVLAQADIRK
jgi:hypothetical protein